MLHATILRNRKYYLRRIRIVLAQLGSIRGTILDLGCGEMLLKQNLKETEILSYLGVDSINFGITKDYQQSDVLEFMGSVTTSFDYIFALGLLDHLSQTHKEELLEKCCRRTNLMLVISQANNQNPFLLFRKKLNINNSSLHLIEQLFLFKLPLTRWVWNLSPNFRLRSILATEIICFYKVK